MIRRLSGERVLGPVAVWLVGALLSVSAAVGGVLDGSLETVISQSKIGEKVELSVMIIDGETGATLASHDSARPMIPASNMKLLTSGTALSVLGPEFAFETEIVLQGEGRGRVVVRGSGDPAFGDPDLLRAMELGVDDLLDLIAEKLVGAGAGGAREVVVDDRVFDREFVHPTWPESQLNRRYCAEVAGLNFHRNVIGIYASPGPVGRPPTVTLEPEFSSLEIANNARSVGHGKQQTAWASRKHGTNEIGLHGDVRYSDQPVEVTLHDPAVQFARMLSERLARAGGPDAAARVATPDENLEGGERVYLVRTALVTVLERCNIDSQNLYAESLLKRVGREVTGAPGSWANGAAVVRMELIERLGTWAGSDVTVADGSGMSRENEVTTRAIAKWLYEVGRDPEVGEVFVASLAEAAQEGTLKKRFRKMRPEHEVRAKTGYLSGVSALSGYVIDHHDGRRVIFSIISNEKPNNVPLSRVRELEEKIVLMIDGWMQGVEEASAFGG